MKLLITALIHTSIVILTAVLIGLICGLWTLGHAAGAVVLEWQHGGADYYTVYLKTTNLVTFVPVATVQEKQATIYRDARRHYWYYVTATTNGIESAPSETLYLPRR